MNKNAQLLAKCCSFKGIKCFQVCWNNSLIPPCGCWLFSSGSTPVMWTNVIQITNIRGRCRTGEHYCVPFQSTSNKENIPHKPTCSHAFNIKHIIAHLLLLILRLLDRLWWMNIVSDLLYSNFISSGIRTGGSWVTWWRSTWITCTTWTTSSSSTASSWMTFWPITCWTASSCRCTSTHWSARSRWAQARSLIWTELAISTAAWIVVHNSLLSLMPIKQKKVYFVFLS